MYHCQISLTHTPSQYKPWARVYTLIQDSFLLRSCLLTSSWVSLTSLLFLAWAWAWALPGVLVVGKGGRGVARVDSSGSPPAPPSAAVGTGAPSTTLTAMPPYSFPFLPLPLLPCVPPCLGWDRRGRCC